MVRGKNNGGILGESGDKADTLTLLDSTDSDVEWLNLPPIKGKKPKKKKNFKAHSSSSWSIWGMVKVFLVVSLMGAVVLLCVVSVWLTAQLSDLQQKVEQMEGRSVGSTDDVEKLFKQMAAVNKTMEQQAKSLKSVISSLSTMNKTVLQMSGRVEKLGEGLKAAPELKQLPEKLQTVSQTVATMGSDIQNVKETVDKVSPFIKTTTDALDALRKDIDSIKDQVNTDDTGTDMESLKPATASIVQGLTSQLQTVNSSLSTQLSVLMQSSTQQTDRILKLEETSRMLVKNISSLSSDDLAPASTDQVTKTDDYTSDEFKSSVTQIVHNVLTEESSLPSSSNVESVMANITRVLATLGDLEEKYEHLDDKQSEGGTENTDEELNGDNVEYVTMEMFKTLGDGFEARVENLNTSFVKLKADVTTMSNMLTTQSNTVTNLTHQVQGTQAYLVSLQDRLDQAGNNAPPATEGPVSKKATTVTTVKPETTKPETTNQQEKTGSPGTTPVGATMKRSVSVDWIKNEKDLRINYSRWSNGGEHEVNYDNLTGFLGPHIPDKDLLDSFDEDGNGFYSLEEFSKAFAIPLTIEEPVTDATSPPR